MNTLPSKVVTAEYRRLTNPGGGGFIGSQPPSQTPALQARPALQPRSQFCPVVDVASVLPPFPPAFVAVLPPAPEELPPMPPEPLPVSEVLPPASVVLLPVPEALPPASVVLPPESLVLPPESLVLPPAELPPAELPPAAEVVLEA